MSKAQGSVSRNSPRDIGLDVVRACAVLLVLISHCGNAFAYWFGGHSPWWVSFSGFFGVELFFVLSGFLIGRLLIGIIARKPTSRDWLVFMIRRWMRTLPVYYIWFLFLTVAWPPRFWEPGHTMPWRDALSYVTLTQNLAWPMPDDHWWFGVSWSLTVEEWFYLSFSALLLTAVALFGRRPGFLVVTSAFLLLPALLRGHLPDTVDVEEVLSKVAVLRLDAIAFGIVVAWIHTKGGMIFRLPAASMIVGMLLVLSVWTGWLYQGLGLSEHVWRTFHYDAVSIGFALCLPAAIALRRLPALLEVIVRAITDRSYSIYLVHLSILDMVDYYRAPWKLSAAMSIAVTIVVIAAISSASWRWVEVPILARRPRQMAGA